MTAFRDPENESTRIERLELAVLLLCETLLVVFRDLHPVLGKKQRLKYEQIAAALNKIRQEYGGGE